MITDEQRKLLDLFKIVLIALNPINFFLAVIAILGKDTIK